MCDKYYKPITVQYCIADCVIWVPRLTLLDLQMHSQNRTCLYVGNLLHTHTGMLSSNKKGNLAICDNLDGP